MNKIKLPFILIMLFCILGCKKDSSKEINSVSNANIKINDFQSNEIFASEKVQEKLQIDIDSDERLISKKLEKSEEESIFKKYNRNSWNSNIDNELNEINFNGYLQVFDLTINDTEEEAYGKLIKNYESIKKECSFEKINWYSNNGMYNDNTINDVELAYYKGNFLSFYKYNLSQEQLQNICNMLNIECDISKLNDSEFYKVKSDKWRIYFSHHHNGIYEYYITDSSIYF